MSHPLPFVRAVSTRGYELDTTRSVSIPIIMNYLEHLRWEVMQEPSLGLKEALDEGHFFVVGQQDVELVRRVGMGVPLDVSLVMRKVGRSRAVVEHAIHRSDRPRDDKSLVAHAEVTGMWLGPNRRLARLPEGIREVGRAHAELPAVLLESVHASGIPSPEEAPSFIERPEVTHRSRGLGHIALPELTAELPAHGQVFRHQLVVRPSDLDIFNHVNASKYLRFFEDARHLAGVRKAIEWAHPPTDSAHDDADVCALKPHVRASVSYHQEAVLGDTLDVVGWALPSDATTPVRFQFVLLRGDEAPLCRGLIELD